MKKSELSWYPWYVKDWRSNRKVARMNALERGIYRELLDECWIEGSFADDPEEIAEIAHCTRAEVDVAWPNLWRSFSQRPDGRWVNDKIVRVHMAQLEALARQRDAGRKGGKNRVANLKGTLSHPQASLKGTLSHPQAKREEENTSLLTESTGAAALVAAQPPRTDPPGVSADHIAPNGSRLDRVSEADAALFLATHRPLVRRETS